MWPHVPVVASVRTQSASARTALFSRRLFSGGLRKSPPPRHLATPGSTPSSEKREHSLSWASSLSVASPQLPLRRQAKRVRPARRGGHSASAMAASNVPPPPQARGASATRPPSPLLPPLQRRPPHATCMRTHQHGTYSKVSRSGVCARKRSLLSSSGKLRYGVPALRRFPYFERSRARGAGSAGRRVNDIRG